MKNIRLIAVIGALVLVALWAISFYNGTVSLNEDVTKQWSNVENAYQLRADKTKNLNSQLGRLNSLKRNINGLMNSSDPHMADVRAYVQANAALDAAEAALLVEQGEYNTALEAFGAVVTTAAIDSYDDYDYSSATTDTLRQRLIDLQSLDVADPDYAAAQTEAALVSDLLATPEAAALDVADGELTAAQDDVTEATVGTTDADLQAALEAAANKDGDITPEMLAWAKAQLGID